MNTGFGMRPVRTTFPVTHPDDDVCDEWNKALAGETEFTREVRLKDLQTGDFRYHLSTDHSH